MNTTINLCDGALERARTLQGLGQNNQATQLLRRLLAFRVLPDDIAEEAHTLLAELYLDAKSHRLARRHVAAALEQNPYEAYYHYLMGCTYAEDGNSKPGRAVPHFQEAVTLDPGDVQYLRELGVQALEAGKSALALKSLRRAAELAPDDPETLGQVATALREAGKPAEARSLLQAALFRNSRDRRFHELWSEHEYSTLHAAQDAHKATWTVPDDGPTLLPFRKSKKRIKIGTRTIRTDAASETSGPTILPVKVIQRRAK